MSTWRHSSEVSHFNSSTLGDWQPISAATLEVIDSSMQVSQLSRGAFDVTVGPLVDLWGFGANNNAHLQSRFNRPSVKAINDHLHSVGYDALEIDRQQGAIRKRFPKTRIDLSGIAKGFAVDNVATCLDAKGYKNYLIEVGGELRSRGSRSEQVGWRVAIERPGSTSGEVLRVLNVKDKAIATSGDYRNFYIDGGQRYSHSIDPRTGKPVNHGLVSVTVIAETTVLADAFSTAMIVMGPNEAHAFADQHQLAAHFVHRSVTGKLDEQFSASFASYMT